MNFTHCLSDFDIKHPFPTFHSTCVDLCFTFFVILMKYAESLSQQVSCLSMLMRRMGSIKDLTKGQNNVWGTLTDMSSSEVKWRSSCEMKKKQQQQKNKQKKRTSNAFILKCHVRNPDVVSRLASIRCTHANISEANGNYLSLAITFRNVSSQYSDRNSQWC